MEIMKSRQTTVTLEGINTMSRLAMHALLPSSKAREFVITRFGAINGKYQHLGRLEALISQSREETS